LRTTAAFIVFATASSLIQASNSYLDGVPGVSRLAASRGLVVARVLIVVRHQAESNRLAAAARMPWPRRKNVLASNAFGPFQSFKQATPSIITDLQTAARKLDLQLIIVNARTDSDLETAFAALSQQRVGAVLVGPSILYGRHTAQLAALAARHALPAIFVIREYVLAGGLMSYGTNTGYSYHQLGIYTGRILKGEKPADLPVEQPTKLELVINLKTAKALGLTIPETLLATADEVIQ
jgi:hypothetical protein